jgi:hypothetical protein
MKTEDKIKKIIYFNNVCREFDRSYNHYRSYWKDVTELAMHKNGDAESWGLRGTKPSGDN